MGSEIWTTKNTTKRGLEFDTQTEGLGRYVFLILRLYISSMYERAVTKAEALWKNNLVFQPVSKTPFAETREKMHMISYAWLVLLSLQPTVNIDGMQSQCSGFKARHQTQH